MNEIKTLKVFGYEIKSNLCSALDYSLYIKRFGEWVVSSGNKHCFTLSMNHIRIWELLEEAINIKMEESLDDDNKYLVIETKDFIVSFKIPQEVKR